MESFVSICENRDFRRIYTRGKSYVSPVLVVYVLKNRTHSVRIGITTSKKIGNAVNRNRSRRVIREAFRGVAPQVKSGYDFVFVARARTCSSKMPQIQQAMVQQLQKAGVLK